MHSNAHVLLLFPPHTGTWNTLQRSFSRRTILGTTFVLLQTPNRAMSCGTSRSTHRKKKSQGTKTDCWNMYMRCTVFVHFGLCNCTHLKTILDTIQCCQSQVIDFVGESLHNCPGNGTSWVHVVLSTLPGSLLAGWNW